MTEEEFIEASLKFAPPNTKIVKIEKDGYTFFQIGELNIEKAARLFYDLLIEQERKRNLKNKKEDVYG